MNRELIYEYEMYLLGKSKVFSNYYFRFSDSQNEKMALEVFKYAFDTYLRWSPEQLRNHLTYDIIERLKLTVLLKYIQFPSESERSKDLYSLVAKLYPNKFKESVRDVVCRVYVSVMRGERDKFPKEFFNGTDGRYKALLCFQIMLNNLPPFGSTEEMYQTFAGPSGVALLRKYRLYTVSAGIFEYPIDYLHAALPKKLKSEYYYHYYRFIMKAKKKYSKTV